MGFVVASLPHLLGAWFGCLVAVWNGALADALSVGWSVSWLKFGVYFVLLGVNFL